MISLEPLLQALSALIDLGGPVIALLLALSVLVLGVILFKLWQFHALGVGDHAAIDRALAAWDDGERGLSSDQFRESRSHLAPVLTHALDADATLKPRDRKSVV